MPEPIAALLLVAVACALVAGAVISGSSTSTSTGRSSHGSALEIWHSLQPYRGASRDRLLPGKARRRARRAARADA